jgi:cytochrome c oxidase subunit IV
MSKHGHVLPLKVYIGVWGALMFLTVITVAVAQVDLGPLNVPLALAIASVKAALVALIFMHLLWDEKFNLVVLASSLLFALVFLGFTIYDPLTRGESNIEEKHEINVNAIRPEVQALVTSDTLQHSGGHKIEGHGAVEPAKH